MSCVWMLQRGHSGDGCVLASTLCKYDLRKGDLFVLSWARVRRVRRGSISSELLVCGGGVRSILLLPLVARCLETICLFVGFLIRLPIINWNKLMYKIKRFYFRTVICQYLFYVNIFHSMINLSYILTSSLL